MFRCNDIWLYDICLQFWIIKLYIDKIFSEKTEISCEYSIHSTSILDDIRIF